MIITFIITSNYGNLLKKYNNNITLSFFIIGLLCLPSGIFAGTFAINIANASIDPQSPTYAGGIASLNSSTSNSLDQQEDRKGNQTIKVFNNFTISNTSQPGLGIDHEKGTLYAAYYQGDIDKANIFLLSSNDGGKTFTEPVQVNDIDGDAYIADYAIPVRVDSENNGVYVLWQHIKGNESGINFYESDFGAGDLKLGKSLDGGKSFQPAISPSGNETPTEKWYADLAVYNNGSNILIPYIDNNLVTVNNVTSYATDRIDYLTQVHVMRSDDGGKTFNKVTIDNSACQCCDIDTAFGPDNEVYIVYRDSDRQLIAPTDPTNKYNYNYTSEDYDKSALESGVSDEITYSTARDVVVAHTVDNGTGLRFSEPVYVQKDRWLNNACPVIGPSMEFDSKGTMHVLYFTGNGTSGTGYYHVTSNDMGKTFNTPEPILVADFLPSSRVQTDLTIDKQNHVWMTFGTVPDIVKHEEESMRDIHVVVLDQDGTKLADSIFQSKSTLSSTPSIVSHDSNAYLSFPDGNSTRILSLTL